MPDDSGFKRSLAVVALLHVCLLGVFFVTSQLGKREPVKETIAWLDGSIGGGEASGEPDLQPVKNEAAPPERTPELISVPKPELLPEPPPPPEEKPLPSELVTSTPTPVPATPKPATPKPATPKPTPKPATPKPTPKTTPKATPKATPAATPKPKASPKPVADEGEESPKPKATPTAKAKATPGAKSEGGADSAAKLAFNKTRGGNGPGAGNGKGTAKSGDGEGTSQFGWYYSMIHDRFHARWEQPTNIDHNGVEVVTLLLLKIDQDGNVIGREIQKPSGFAQMDESVLTAAEKVRQIDPLPAGLGTNGVFEVSMKFRLDQQ